MLSKADKTALKAMFLEVIEAREGTRTKPKARKTTAKRKTVAKKATKAVKVVGAPKYKGTFRVTEPTAPLHKATFGGLYEDVIFRQSPSGADYKVTASELYGDLVTGMGILVLTNHPKGVEFDKAIDTPCYIVG